MRERRIEIGVGMRKIRFYGGIGETVGGAVRVV